MQRGDKNAEETAYTVDSIKSVLKEYANIELADEEAIDLQGRLTVDKDTYLLAWEIGSVIAEHYGIATMSPELRALSSTGGHTANMVPLFAEGYGADAFNGVLDNVEVFELILEIINQ